ncbi:MAG: 50S ribosomal protein L11 methyltransferase [candidate division KSB1 bacterium]|jgi:ribosomal protein L11 methyltransferase|nr:50S ribosomal protein L11 methyltransferase [candidate division KSB1 bacterium]
MQWIEVKITVTDEFEDAVSNRMFELGSVGVSVFENLMRAYFKAEEWSHEAEAELKIYFNDLKELGFNISPESMDVNEIEDVDWNESWKRALKPIHVTDDLVIKPTWTALEKDAGTLVIELDPQMAFGSGAHATTQLALTLLRRNALSIGATLDVGTGSGILSIAAALMKPVDIIAFDIDPVAVATARENCKRNEVLSRIQLFAGTIHCLRSVSFDTILANINRTAITNMMTELRAHLKKGGLLILSGILISERELISDHLKENHMDVLEEAEQDEWLGFVVTKNE